MRVLACVVITLQATFSVRTEMVVLPVTVTDARGHSVAGLTVDQFRVFDDGALQSIALFRGGEVPMTIGLVVDHSQSMGPKLRSVNAAAAAFARSGHADDEMFAIGFNDEVRLLPLQGGKVFTHDASDLDAALAELIPGGSTALYDAVAEALRRLGPGRGERKALVVVSDGGDNASHLKYGQIRDLVRQSQAVIYGVGLIGADYQDEDPEILKRLCRDSGGIAYFPATREAIAGAFTQIATDLREQYTLGFVPAATTSKNTSHSITVRVADASGASLKVRTRSGYDTGSRK